MLLTVGVVPVALLGWFSYETSRGELDRTVGQIEIYAARDLARFCEKVVADGVDQLKLATSYIPFDQLTANELSAVLGIPYRQLSQVNAVVVVDQDGEAMSQPVYASPAAPVSGHEALSPTDLEIFARSIPLAEAVSHGVAISRPYRPPGSASARLAVAIRASNEPVRVLAAELSLREIQERVDEMSRAGDDLVWAVDPHGKVLAAPGVTPSNEMLSLAREGGRSTAPLVRTVVGHDGDEWVSAFVPVERLGWGSVASQRAAKAYRTARRLAALTAFWSGVALVLTFVLGAFLARGLSRPIEGLSTAAKALTQGNYASRVDIKTEDELGQFAGAFNHMASEVQRRDEEIRLWYEQMEKRVEERTMQLQAVQEQVLRSRHLTAIGSLSAGFAHELNNPMTGVIGLLSILSKQIDKDSETGETVGLALEHARRVSKIVREFQNLADVTSEAHHQRLVVTRPVQTALDTFTEALRSHSIRLSTHFDEGLPEILGDSAQIQQLVSNLVKNAIEATSQGGAVRVTLHSAGGEAVELRVADTGKGISPVMRERIFDPFFSSKDHDGQVGLGLSTVQRIVEAHYGRITVESREGKGTTFVVFLPAAPKPAHLY